MYTDVGPFYIVQFSSMQLKEVIYVLTLKVTPLFDVSFSSDSVKSTVDQIQYLDEYLAKCDLRYISVVLSIALLIINKKKNDQERDKQKTMPLDRSVKFCEKCMGKCTRILTELCVCVLMSMCL